MRTVELEGVHNVRDLGGIAVEGGRIIEEGLVFRGSALNAATPADLLELFDRRGISCVIDVRCSWEREEHPDRLARGVEYLPIPLFGREEVGIEYTEPAAGTKVVGRDVACVPEHFYRALANPLTAGQMARALEQIFTHVEQGRPVYVHCSGGKDRAGILTLLVLSILGADWPEIERDYLLTNISRDARYEQNFARFLRLADDDEELAHKLTRAHRARPENLQAFRESVEARYGSMEIFIREKLGFSSARRKELRTCLTHPVAEMASVA